MFGYGVCKWWRLILKNIETSKERHKNGGKFYLVSYHTDGKSTKTSTLKEYITQRSEVC